MITKPIESRAAGRPRLFTDTDIFHAVTAVIGQSGYTNLTLAAVATELGCTAPALSKRFGSRQDLVRAYLDWTHEQALERFREVRASNDSPLAALRARMMLPIGSRTDEIAGPEDSAHHASLHLAAEADPEFKLVIASRMQFFEDEFEALLADAVVAGELRSCDTRKLAQLLFKAVVGTTQIAALRGTTEPLEHQLGATVDAVVEPYRAYQTSNQD
jgi:AcrR family transcriptional regulator